MIPSYETPLWQAPVHKSFANFLFWRQSKMGRRVRVVFRNIAANGSGVSDVLNGKHLRKPRLGLELFDLPF
jgi:hypothetical protein